ncbi:ORF56 [Ranid herpesvirus 2]|uniref:ORF56 n=1 Tax=Ranid herpesvirus 2 TaxID=389214 RepID=Q14W50_9VIRU|nr:ORF56 [Ranid herpesvirus 2]ABG25656.1 ORF56 [Ranid herpesvirus 2]
MGCQLLYYLPKLGREEPACGRRTQPLHYLLRLVECGFQAESILRYERLSHGRERFFEVLGRPIQYYSTRMCALYVKVYYMSVDLQENFLLYTLKAQPDLREYLLRELELRDPAGRCCIEEYLVRMGVQASSRKRCDVLDMLEHIKVLYPAQPDALRLVLYVELLHDRICLLSFRVLREKMTAEGKGKVPKMRYVMMEYVRRYYSQTQRDHLGRVLSYDVPCHYDKLEKEGFTLQNAWHYSKNDCVNEECDCPRKNRLFYIPRRLRDPLVALNKGVAVENIPYYNI